MAGFMAGFGSAFAQSFNQANQQIAQDKSDLFKMKFQAEMSRKEKLDAIDAENAKHVKAAKQIAHMTGQPPEAWSALYEQLANGATYAQVQTNAETYEAVVNPNSKVSTDVSGPADPSQDLTAGAEGAVTAQMTQSGMTPPAPQEASLFGRPSREQQNNTEADAKVAEAMGDDPRALDAAVQGAPNPAVQGDVIPAASDYNITWKKKADKEVWETNSLEEAVTLRVRAEEAGDAAGVARADKLIEAQTNVIALKASAEAKAKGEDYTPNGAAMFDENGNFMGTAIKADRQGSPVWVDPKTGREATGIVIPHSKQANEDMNVIAEKLAPQVDEYNKATDSFKSMVRTSSELVSLSEMVPEGLDISGSIAQGFDRYKRAGLNILDIITPKITIDEQGRQVVVVNSGSISALESIEESMQADIDSGVLNNIDRVAVAAALMDIKATKLAYMYAATSGQVGRGVTQQEFEIHKQNAMGNGNPKALKLGAQSFIDGEKQKLQDMEKSINQNSTLMRRFESQHRFPAPFQPAESFDEMINSDQGVVDALARLEGPSNSDQTKQPGLEPVPTEVSTNYPAITPEAWAEMDEVTRKLFLPKEQ